MPRISTLLLALLAAGTLALVGCGPSTPPAKPPVEDPHAGHNHSKGPHGGAIAEAGVHHIEWLRDDKAHKLSIWVLDESMQKEVAVPADKVLVVVAVAGKPDKQVALPPTNAADGQATRFEVEDESLLTALGVGKGKLKLELAGKPVEVPLEAHDHHDHGHDH